MKKITTGIIALSLLMVPALVLGQGGVTPEEPPATIDIPAIITRVLNWAFGLLLAVAVAFFLYAAFMYLSGTEENIKKAKKTIIYVIIAIVIAFASRGLAVIIKSLIMGPGA